MSFLLKLPEHVIASCIFSSFLTIEDISTLDRAATSKSIRSTILSIFQKCILFSNLDTSSSYRINYCINRCIRFQHCSFLDEIVDESSLSKLFIFSASTFVSIRIFNSEKAKRRPEQCMNRFLQIVASFPLMSLKSLVIYNGLTLTDTSFPSFQKLSHNRIEELHLDFCRFSVEGLSCILPLFSHLTSLSLKYSKCNDSIVAILVISCPLLQTLDFHGCTDISDESVRLISKNLEYLNNLSLSRCRSLTDRSLQYLSKGNPCLKYLWMDSCVHLTNNGLQAIKHRTFEFDDLGRKVAPPLCPPPPFLPATTAFFVFLVAFSAFAKYSFSFISR